MQEPVWQGELWLAHDFCLIRGANGSTAAHAHYAHQVLLGLDGPLRIQLDDEECSGRLLLVASMRRHALADPSQPMLALYAEPLAFALETLEDALAHVEPTPEAILERLRQAPRKPLDRRVERALATLEADPAEPRRAADLARSACLSLSQLERLFAGQVGLSVRRLVLWRRLRVALALALQGQRLTEAAHAAGFADAAHLSRTVRATFGIRADRHLRQLRLHLLA